MIFYTIYTSRPRTPMTLDVLEDIRQASVRNNPSRNITGILLGIENRYLQYLEGDEDKVLELFEKIKADGRHYEVTQWVRGYTKKRIFSEWSMGSWMLSNKVLNSLSALKDLGNFIKDPMNESLQSARFIGMMQDLLKTWIAHEPERSSRLKFNG